MRKKLIAHEDPKSPISEIFRTLRTNVQFMNSNKKLKTLLVTSTLPGEGKSWVSSNLAVAFAQTGQRVVLIDADMRKCTLHNMFEVALCPGLSNYLAGVNEKNQEANNIVNYLRKTEVPNLYLMPAGNIPPNPSELLITPQMVDLLENLKMECDLIIIDGTPSKLVTDSVILSRIVDSTIIVAAYNQSKKDDLIKVVRDIKNVGGNIAGIVYNKKPTTSKKAQETYYYSSTMPAVQPKSNVEFEYEERRRAQRSRATDMLDRDRRPENYKNLQQNEDSKDNSTEITKNPEITNNSDTTNNFVDKIETNNKTCEKPPEERVADVLKEFNEYLQREKNMRDDNRS